ncbi:MULTISPECIES: hypothetical protein [unclassified Micromonospora]
MLPQQIDQGILLARLDMLYPQTGDDDSREAARPQRASVVA